MTKLKVVASWMLVALIGLASPVAADPKDTQGQQRLAETLYSGIRISSLLDSHVFSKEGGHLGQVRNIVLADDGSVKAVIAEQAGIGIMPEYVFRLPWNKVVQPVRSGILIADLSDVRSNQFGLFPPRVESAKEETEFLVTEVTGDYARLQTGLGYGVVKDVVLTPQGRMIAVLIARDASSGGGTVAFPYPGRTGRWNPGMSYYGLPFVTVEQANDAAFKVDLRRFQSAS